MVFVGLLTPVQVSERRWTRSNQLLPLYETPEAAGAPPTAHAVRRRGFVCLCWRGFLLEKQAGGCVSVAPWLWAVAPCCSLRDNLNPDIPNPTCCHGDTRSELLENSFIHSIFSGRLIKKRYLDTTKSYLKVYCFEIPFFTATGSDFILFDFVDLATPVYIYLIYKKVIKCMKMKRIETKTFACLPLYQFIIYMKPFRWHAQTARFCPRVTHVCPVCNNPHCFWDSKEKLWNET